MFRLFLCLFILTSGANALFGIGGSKASPSQKQASQHSSPSKPTTSIFNKFKKAVTPPKKATPPKAISQQNTSKPKTGILSSLKKAVTPTKKPTSPAAPTNTQQNTTKPKTGILSSLKKAVTPTKKPTSPAAPTNTQQNTTKPKTGILSSFKKAVTPAKKPTSATPTANSSQPKTDIFSKLKNAVSSKKVTNSSTLQGEEGLEEGAISPPKQGIFSKLKNAVSSKKVTNSSTLQGEEGLEEGAISPPKQGIFSKLKNAVSSKKGTTTSLTEDPEGLEQEGISPSKPGLLSKIKGAVLPGQQADGTPKPALLTRLAKNSMNLATSTQCTAAKCTDPKFMTPENAMSCLSTVDRARTNINCSKAFYNKFCQDSELAGYEESCQIASEAIQHGANMVGQLTNVASKVNTLVNCTAAYCGTPNLKRNDLYKCIGTPKLIKLNQACANTYYSMHCQNSENESPLHAAEFCNIISEQQGESNLETAMPTEDSNNEETLDGKERETDSEGVPPTVDLEAQETEEVSQGSLPSAPENTEEMSSSDALAASPDTNSETPATEEESTEQSSPAPTESTDDSSDASAAAPDASSETPATEEESTEQSSPAPSESTDDSSDASAAAPDASSETPATEEESTEQSSPAPTESTDDSSDASAAAPDASSETPATEKGIVKTIDAAQPPKEVTVKEGDTTSLPSEKPTSAPQSKKRSRGGNCQGVITYRVLSDSNNFPASRRTGRITATSLPDEDDDEEDDSYY
jgi:hypothetical protein